VKTNEEYYEGVLKNRELVKELMKKKCPCPYTKCDWYGKCKECVALHCHYKTHIPACLQPILKDKMRELVQTVEMVAVDREPKPAEHYVYKEKMDKEREQSD